MVLWQHFFNVFLPPFMAISTSINRKSPLHIDRRLFLTRNSSRCIIHVQKHIAIHRSIAIVVVAVPCKMWRQASAAVQLGFNFCKVRLPSPGSASFDCLQFTAKKIVAQERTFKCWTRAKVKKANDTATTTTTSTLQVSSPSRGAEATSVVSFRCAVRSFCKCRCRGVAYGSS